MELSFILTSIGLGVGLAMDAFSVSLANGLNEPRMKKTKMAGIAGMFGFFQAFMPMLGWVFVHTLAETFREVTKFIPWIALGLLLLIGGKMLFDGIKGGEEEKPGVGIWALFVQGVATSIDALSVGFEIYDYDGMKALICSLIIAFVTFLICVAGLLIGRKAGTVLSSKAQILGGVILIAIGLEIFIKSFL